MAAAGAAMQWRTTAIAWLLAATAVAAQAPAERTPPPLPAGGETRTLQVAGVTRSYHLVRPPGARTPAPVVLALHGGSVKDGRNLLSWGLSRRGAEEGVVTVYPDGLVLGWNDGRTSPDLQRMRGGADDLGFLRALVDALVAEGVADPRRIAVTGGSNGGMMALRLACEMADRLVAVAVVTAPLSTEQAQGCRPARPVSVLVMNGTADATFPYGGGRAAGPPGQDFGGVLSLEATGERWRAWNRCRGAPERYALPDRDPADGTRIRLQASRNCARGAEVLLYTVEGGGHSLPGLPGGGRAGVSSKDADGPALIWAFLRRHQR